MNGTSCDNCFTGYRPGQLISCDDCGSEWTEKYKIAGYKLNKKGERI